LMAQDQIHCGKSCRFPPFHPGLSRDPSCWNWTRRNERLPDFEGQVETLKFRDECRVLIKKWGL
jgi:hypothetical protein